MSKQVKRLNLASEFCPEDCIPEDFFGILKGRGCLSSQACIRRYTAWFFTCLQDRTWPKSKNRSDTEHFTHWSFLTSCIYCWGVSRGSLSWIRASLAAWFALTPEASDPCQMYKAESATHLMWKKGALHGSWAADYPSAGPYVPLWGSFIWVQNPL